MANIEAKRRQGYVYATPLKPTPREVIPSTSKNKERLSVSSTSTGKFQLDHRDSSAASLPKSKCSDEESETDNEVRFQWF